MISAELKRMCLYKANDKPNEKKNYKGKSYRKIHCTIFYSFNHNQIKLISSESFPAHTLFTICSIFSFFFLSATKFLLCFIDIRLFLTVQLPYVDFGWSLDTCYFVLRVPVQCACYMFNIISVFSYFPAFFFVWVDLVQFAIKWDAVACIKCSNKRADRNIHFIYVIC